MDGGTPELEVIEGDRCATIRRLIGALLRGEDAELESGLRRLEQRAALRVVPPPTTSDS